MIIKEVVRSGEMVQQWNLYWIVLPYIVRIAPAGTSEEKRPGSTVTTVLPITWGKRPGSLILAQHFLPLLTLPRARILRYSKNFEETKMKKNTPPNCASPKEAYFNKKQMIFSQCLDFKHWSSRQHRGKQDEPLGSPPAPAPAGQKS